MQLSMLKVVPHSWLLLLLQVLAGPAHCAARHGVFHDNSGTVTTVQLAFHLQVSIMCSVVV